MTALTKLAGVASGATLAAALLAAPPAGAFGIDIDAGLSLPDLRLPAGSTVATVQTPAGTALVRVELPAGVSLEDLSLGLDCDLSGATVDASTTVSSLLSAEAQLLSSADGTCSAAQIEAGGIDGVEVDAVVDLTGVLEELETAEAGVTATASPSLPEAGAQVTTGTGAPVTATAGVAAGTGTGIATSGTATARTAAATGGATGSGTTTAATPASGSGTEILGLQVDSPGTLARTGAGLGGLTLAGSALLGGGRLLGLFRRLFGG